MKQTQISLCFCKSQDPSKITAEDYSSPAARRKDFRQSEFGTTRSPVLSICYSYYVSNIESFGNQKLLSIMILHLRVQTILEVGNKLCVTTMKNKLPARNTGKHQSIFRNKILDCTLERLHKWWRSQQNSWDVLFLFPDIPYFQKEQWKTANWNNWKSMTVLNAESGLQT